MLLFQYYIKEHTSYTVYLLALRIVMTMFFSIEKLRELLFRDKKQSCEKSIRIFVHCGYQCLLHELTNYCCLFA